MDPNFSPFSGEFIKVLFQPTNMPGPIGTCDGIDVTVDPFEVDVESWQNNRTANVKMVANGKRGIQRIRGPRDWSGSMNLIYNRMELLHDPSKAGIVEGTYGTIYLFTDCTDDTEDAYSFDVIIETVGDSFSFQGVLMQAVSWSLADGQSIQYPAYA